ncbi:MAG: hypothetical protein KKH94_05505 [Candidatus Omnitrophica bacterium]|nr:hypothetical protein [Candidatus Omnitrophota bacterium]
MFHQRDEPAQSVHSGFTYTATLWVVYNSEWKDFNQGKLPYFCLQYPLQWVVGVGLTTGLFGMKIFENFCGKKIFPAYNNAKFKEVLMRMFSHSPLRGGASDTSSSVYET